MSWVHRVQLQASDSVFDGKEANELRRALELPSARLSGSGQGRASIAEQVRLVAACAARGEFRTAIAVSESFGLCHFGPAATLLSAARDLREFVHVLNSFAPLLNLRHEVSVQTSSAGTSLRLGALVNLSEEGSQILLLLDRAKLVRFISDLLGLDPAWVSTGHGLGASRASLAIPAGFAECVRTRCSARVSRDCERECRKQMQSMEDERLPEAVRRLLFARPGSPPDFGEVAAYLGYSRRTFRRRLAEQDTSFAEILNAVRQTLALRYVTSTNLTVDEIAEKLGYSESANFRHAFRRWTGVSPRSYGCVEPMNCATASASVPTAATIGFSS